MIRKMIAKVTEGENLTEEETRKVISEIMEGKATSAQIASFLTALRMKGETVEEITGCAKEMLNRASSFDLSEDVLVDTCGTGGDGSNTFNISTAVAFVVAGVGLVVAKHGNRALSSRCGSADVLEVLGVKLDISLEKLKECLKRIGIGFLFAPLYHRAMKYALGPRQEIGIRTIFNILGPLTNPLRANVRLLGVYHPSLTEPLARVLKNLGVKGAFVVHGEDGLDEISLSARTRITQLKEGRIKTYYIKPEDLGMRRVSQEAIRGGDGKENARILRSILEGEEKGAKREIVLLNSAACLVAADMAKDLKEGIEMARESIDSGRAKEKLEMLIALTNA
ncbi:anthranilate phosphoribosyltransferase [Candidatus Aerophobetes bacterium]|uniref:Anthranilate phosphoribosyltransferase n=1 Tax=Aerophobetes bacterium TaxID=2030807 RepID=A0A497E5Y6_UNCAE|nr:MAG: anthranilate phosphoribosyltransferase [Candidatus Aerophobetes bacterium]